MVRESQPWNANLWGPLRHECAASHRRNTPEKKSYGCRQALLLGGSQDTPLVQHRNLRLARDLTAALLVRDSEAQGEQPARGHTVGKGHGLGLEPEQCAITEVSVPSVRTAEIPTVGLGHDLDPVMCVP